MHVKKMRWIPPPWLWVNQFFIKKNTQVGVSLIEVLVAIVLTAFGLLGLASLQVAAIRYQKVAHSRALATQFLGDMSDRMRANIVGARDGAYTIDATKNYPDPLPNSSPPSPECKGSTTCDPQQLARFDLYEWRTQLKETLPKGWGKISGDIDTGFKILVYFYEDTKDETELIMDCPEVLNKKIRCLSIGFLP